MSDRSITAYSLPERLSSYDRDMELMHPNRSKMARVVLELLPLPVTRALRALDLGVGTGYLAAQFLERFGTSHVWALDGSQAMLDLAAVRLDAYGDRVSYVRGDYRQVANLVGSAAPFDVVLSAFALHHVNAAEKADVVRQVRDLLRPGGWFLNADILRAESPQLERRVQELRVDGIVRRNDGREERFRDAIATRRHLDDLEAADGDQPLSLQDELSVLAKAGLRESGAFWIEYREAVTGGIA